MHLNELHTATEQLLSHLQAGLPEDGREEYIQHLNDLLETRMNVLTSVELNALGMSEKQALLSTDKKIQTLILDQQYAIKGDINRLKAQQEKNQKYANPYQSVAHHDGQFYDKRK